MKMNRDKIKNYITYSWYIILLVCIFSYTLSYYVVSSLTKYKKEEVFSIFVTSYELKDKELEKKLLNKYHELGIEQVNIYNYLYEDKDIASYYANFGKKSDIVILYEPDLNEMKEYIKDNFICISISGYETYDYDGKAYAIKIYDSNSNENYLYNYFEFQGDIKCSAYLLINIDSVHFSSKEDLGYLIINDLLWGNI